MGREIKFRAWNKKAGSWYKGAALQLTAMRGFSFGLSESNRKIIQINQYTGLKDKNGHEIYEGDVVTPEYPTLKNITDAWVVEYSHTGAFVLADGSFKELLHDQVHNKWKLEVIGNIYENPELLDDKRRVDKEAA